MADITAIADASGRRKPGLAGRIVGSPTLMQGAALAVSTYMRAVKATLSIVRDPDPTSLLTDVYTPFIAVGWHGQFLMLPALALDHRPYDALVSSSADGELIARTIGCFGHGTVRGSGAQDKSRMHEKGGIEAMRNLRGSLDQGRSVIVTANFLRTARREVSRGIVTLARVTGRPVVPFGIVTSRSITINSWDRTTINLPFSKCGVVAGDPVFVPAEASPEEADSYRIDIGRGIDAAIARAESIARHS